MVCKLEDHFLLIELTLSSVGSRKLNNSIFNFPLTLVELVKSQPVILSESEGFLFYN